MVNRNNVNPIQLLQMIKQGKNPQQLMMSILEQRMGNTPMGENLLKLAKNNDKKEIENIARNIMKQRGVDYDKEFEAFKQLLGVANQQ